MAGVRDGGWSDAGLVAAGVLGGIDGGIGGLEQSGEVTGGTRPTRHTQPASGAHDSIAIGTIHRSRCPALHRGSRTIPTTAPVGYAANSNPTATAPTPIPAA